MGIVLGIIFFMAAAGTIFLLFMWGLWILGIAGDFLLGIYRVIFRKSGKTSGSKSRVRITPEIDPLDYSICRKPSKYTITID